MYLVDPRISSDPHDDSVDFSERHLEEVISFFWRSVYKLVNINTERKYTNEFMWLFKVDR